MADLKLIDAARSGDADRVRELLAGGADVHQQDEQGWTPLNWAAGRGDTPVVRALLEHGADVTLTGRDNRTPLRIAKAAGHDGVVEILTAAEQERGVWEDPSETRPYCRAYPLEELEAFPGFQGRAADGESEDAEVVFLHQDFTVTRSMWHGEDVVFDEVTPEWKAFCRERLEFAIPPDLL